MWPIGRGPRLGAPSARSANTKSTSLAHCAQLPARRHSEIFTRKLLHTLPNTVRLLTAMRERGTMANAAAHRADLFGGGARAVSRVLPTKCALLAGSTARPAADARVSSFLSSLSTMQERLPDGPVQRASLFGRPGGAGAGAASGQAAHATDNGARHALEEDNDRLTADLEIKVAALKQASLGIHDEVSEHNRMLTGMVSEGRGWRGAGRENGKGARGSHDRLTNPPHH